jgi:putative peptidoglycan lipid II flippase
MGSAYILIGILQSKGEYLVPALVSAISNIGVIFYFVFLDKYFGVYGLSAAFLASWAIQLLTLVIPFRGKKYRYKFKLDFKNPELIRAIKTTIPIMAGAWLIPVGRLIALKYASLVTVVKNTAVVSSFNYAMNLFLIITGILTHGICNYIFPKLAQNSDEENKPEFLNIVKNGLSATFFIILPVSCIAYILRDEAVVVILMHGKFTEDVARITSDMLAALLPAMIMYSVIEILNRVYYAKNMVKVPMVASLCGIALNIVLCEIFIAKAGLTPFYIAAASFFSQSLTAAILTGALFKKYKEMFTKRFFSIFIKTLISSAILSVLLKFIYNIINNDVFNASLPQNIIAAGAVAIAGVIIYPALNFMLKTDLLVSLIKKKKER